MGMRGSNPCKTGIYLLSDFDLHHAECSKVSNGKSTRVNMQIRGMGYKTVTTRVTIRRGVARGMRQGAKQQRIG
jgi:hypothetical protein